jgi:RNA polymerase sigma-70 factor (ECF subfamily)
MQTVYPLSERGAAWPSARRAEAPDLALIGAIAEGDKRAMSALFARYNVRVFRFILRMTKRQSLAEDLVNEVFLEVWRQAGKFEARSQVSTWLLGIARFKALSAMRHRPDEELTEEAMLLIEDPADNPETVLERSDRCSQLRRCLTRLSPAHREIIDLVYYHEKSVAEVSEIIGVPPSTIKTRMFYARKKLARYLQEADTGCAAA